MPGIVSGTLASRLIRLQSFKEVTWGTPGLATARWMGVQPYPTFKPYQKSTLFDEDRGSLQNNFLSAVLVEGGEFSINMHATYEEIEFMLQGGLQAVSPTGGPAYTWAHAAPTNAAWYTQSYTLEYGYDIGTIGASGCMINKWSLKGSPKKQWEASMSGFFKTYYNNAAVAIDSSYSALSASASPSASESASPSASISPSMSPSTSPSNSPSASPSASPSTSPSTSPSASFPPPAYGEIEITTSSAHGYSTGDQVVVAGHSDSGANGTWVITVTGNYTFTLDDSSGGVGGTGGTVTKIQTPGISDRTVEVILFPGTTLSMEASGGTLGTTPFTNQLMSFNLDVMAGLVPVYGSDSKTPIAWTYDKLTPTLTLRLLWTAQAKAFLNSVLKAGQRSVCRLQNSSGSKSATLDFSGVLADDPTFFPNEQSAIAVDFKMEGQYESTSIANDLKATIVNAVSALP